MTYPDSFEHKIGFDLVKEHVIKLCASAPGRNAAMYGIKFSAEYDTVSRRLRETDEMVRILSEKDAFTIGSLADMDEILGRVRAEGTILSSDDLLAVERSLSVSAEISGYFNRKRNEEGLSPYPLLDIRSMSLMTFPAITSLIDRTIDRFGTVKDSASAELSQIRRSMSSTAASLNSIMRRVISRAIENGLLEADTSPVMRDGRFVLPVSPMNKRKINGIVHDESSSGKTFYIEPAEMVEANNRIRELQIEEKREISRILKEVTDKIRPDIDVIIQTVREAGNFDFIMAKALYAAETGGLLPNLTPTAEIDWFHACHPVLLLSLKRHGKEIVPLDISLTEKDRMLIISGPNAGGKSVCLKTVGIIQYMAQSGLLPPVYENSHLGIFDKIFIDIGDDQSLEDDLSTYSSHLRNMKFFLQHGNDKTLVLIDEFGGGTEPQIGGAIAQAILKNFNGKKMWGVITTHYQNLKNFAEDTPGLINGSMLYDRHLMQPLFKLSIGNPGSSFAIEIAKKTGLPASIIADAEDIVGSDYVNLDRYLLDIARDKRYWENKREQIRQKEKRIDSIMTRYEQDADTLRDKRREILNEAKQQAREIIEQSNASVERTIREIRQFQADKEKTRLARQKLADERERLIKPHTSEEHPLLKNAPKNKKRRTSEKKEQVNKPLSIGDNVKLEGQTTVGTILDIQGKNALVSFGMLKTTVATDRLTPTMSKPAAISKNSSFISASTTESIRDRQLGFRQEIDVRGMRVDEAIQAVTYFVDDAIQFNAQRIRILHGTGTGALRQSIRQYLDTVKGVSSYRDEHVQFGGAGITVVDLE